MSGDRKYWGNRPKGERDEILGAALRRLEIPEHRPSFHAELRAKLDSAIPGENAVDLERPAAPGPSWLRRGQRRRRQGWMLGLVVAAAVVLALILVVANLPGTSPGMASAAGVRAAVSRAWASARGIAGVLVVHYRHPVVGSQQDERWRFLITARGDFRLIGLEHPGADVYDAASNIERSLNTSASIPGSTVLFASELTGLAPGPPDPGPSSTVLDRGLGSAVRALAAGRGGQVREVTYQGRPAWLLDTALPSSGALYPDHLQVTVDQQTGFPVRVLAFRGGQMIYETRIEDLSVNPPIPVHAFSLKFPPGKQVFHTDFGFRPERLANAGRSVGYAPLVPAFIPAGYRLSEVMVSVKPSATGTNPAVGDIVSLSYRRGLDQFIVTTRPVGPHPRAWSDPLGSGQGNGQGSQRIKFSSGALAGRTGHLVLGLFAAPHIWALAPELVVTVSGDLTRAQLVHVADSLRQV
jgi:hypothetical protein